MCIRDSRQTSIASSQRRSWTMSDDEKKAFAGAECNGEILNGFDGLNGSTMVANGLKITNEGNFETTEAYGGWALRVGFGVRFEYAYGSRDISDGCLCFLWINRRDLSLIHISHQQKKDNRLCLFHFVCP